MLWMQRVALLVMGLGLLALTLHLIRRRRLREEYAVLWVLTTLVVLGFVLMPSVLFTLAAWLHLDHSVLLLFVVFLFLVGILIHYSVVISRHSECEKRLTQEIALLKDEIARLRDEGK
jgi:hypothetical protein